MFTVVRAIFWLIVLAAVGLILWGLSFLDSEANSKTEYRVEHHWCIDAGFQRNYNIDGFTIPCLGRHYAYFYDRTSIEIYVRRHMDKVGQLPILIERRK